MSSLELRTALAHEDVVSALRAMQGLLSDQEPRQALKAILGELAGLAKEAPGLYTSLMLRMADAIDTPQMEVTSTQ